MFRPSPPRIPSVIVAGSLCVVAVARPATIHVPADYPTLQEAIDAASAGDEIVIACGEYGPWNEVLLKGDLTIRSETGSEDCVTLVRTELAGADLVGPITISGLTLDGQESLWLFGLDLARCETIRVQSSRFTDLAVGMNLDACPDVVIENSRIDGNRVRDDFIELAAGIHAPSSDLLLESCELIGNVTGYGFAGGMYVDPGVVTATDCRFEDNDGAYVTHTVHTGSFSGCEFREAGLGVHSVFGGELHFEDCFVDGGSPFVSGYAVSLLRCTVVGGTWDRRFVASQLDLDQVIVAGNHTPSNPLFSCNTVAVDCSIFWDNTYAPGCADSAIALGQNFLVDPLFCDAAKGDYTVAASSPALPANNACGLPIGAFGAACGVVSVEALRSESLAEIKMRYRGRGRGGP